MGGLPSSRIHNNLSLPLGANGLSVICDFVISWLFSLYVRLAPFTLKSYFLEVEKCSVDFESIVVKAEYVNSWCL